MNNLIIGVLSLALACIGIVLKKTYYYLPVNELKRRAEKSDPVAVKLYTPMSYGSSLKVLLWLYIGLTSAVSFILFAREMPIWLSLLIIGPLIYVVFSLLPSSRVTKFGITLTKLATPILNWLLNYLHPLLSRGSEKVEKKYIISNHTGLYERTDLIDLINRQQKQADNRLSEKELDTLKRALIFNDKKVSDILTSWDKVKTILSKDTIGPILINELHKSGQQFILVKDTPKGSVVGILAFTDLNLKSHGKVENNMNDSIYYINEDDSLNEALHGFFTTNQPLFIVVNNSEEYVGILTIENILKELLGFIPEGEFEDYANITAVATRHHKRSAEEAEDLDTSETPVKTAD